MESLINDIAGAGSPATRSLPGSVAQVGDRTPRTHESPRGFGDVDDVFNDILGDFEDVPTHSPSHTPKAAPPGTPTRTEEELAAIPVVIPPRRRKRPRFL